MVSSITSRAWYSEPIVDFCAADPNTIIGALATHCDFKLLESQTSAWIEQIRILQPCLSNLEGSVYFEFNIPRMGRRIDVVIVSGSIVFAVEFKIGATGFDGHAWEQVWDYALDLKNFHQTSHDVAILPILVATLAKDGPLPHLSYEHDLVYTPVETNANGLRDIIELALKESVGPTIDIRAWYAGAYMPTPTIVEAARSLYAKHSVEAIARYDAGAKNLAITSQRVDDLVDLARNKNRKIICFVTGVPGAGKTLVGLNVATQHRKKNEPTHAVFLSGNGPLVAVLVEALTRDENDRQKAAGKSIGKGRIRESVKAFIQNVHHYRDEALIDSSAPADHVAIFDEAQRAWNLHETKSFMSRKKNFPNFDQSEPEFLIRYMDRHIDWAVIVCLVGGGQEINKGEAGISEWVEAVRDKFPKWNMYISSELTDSEYKASEILDAVKSRPHTHLDESLHLAVSMRSFRADNVSAFVKALLDCELKAAKQAFENFRKQFPLAITRDLNSAKKWIKKRARGSERFGLVASSKAMRLRPHAIDVRVKVDPVHYFLNERTDVRSSYYLEDAATEFQVQGLELDWVCVTWDGDLRRSATGWTYHDFKGSKWQNIHNESNRRYALNTYRVLLTRARQGMVIFVPSGDEEDATRKPEYYDRTFNYLADIGIPVI